MAHTNRTYPYIKEAVPHFLVRCGSDVHILRDLSHCRRNRGALQRIDWKLWGSKELNIDSSPAHSLYLSQRSLLVGNTQQDLTRGPKPEHCESMRETELLIQPPISLSLRAGIKVECMKCRNVKPKHWGKNKHLDNFPKHWQQMHHDVIVMSAHEWEILN